MLLGSSPAQLPILHSNSNNRQASPRMPYNPHHLADNSNSSFKVSYFQPSSPKSNHVSHYSNSTPRQDLISQNTIKSKPQVTGISPPSKLADSTLRLSNHYPPNPPLSPSPTTHSFPLPSCQDYIRAAAAAKDPPAAASTAARNSILQISPRQPQRTFRSYAPPVLSAADCLRQVLPGLPTDDVTFVGPSTRYAWRTTEKSLGSGYTSTVHHGWDLMSHGRSIAVKIVPKEKQRLLASDHYYRDLYSRLPAISHPNLLQLHDFFEDSSNFYVITDLCRGSDLVDYVLEFEPGTIPIEIAQDLTFQILSGLNRLHKNMIVHRDIKLDNILFESEGRKQIRIIDFDMGLLLNVPTPPKQLTNPDEVSVVGTKDYMAPECYQGQYNRTSDLWSLGIILFILLDGHFPFNFASAGKGHREAHGIIKQGVKVPAILRQRCPLAVDLMEKLLRLNPSDRIQSACEALAHPWFTQTPPRTMTAAMQSSNKQESSEMRRETSSTKQQQKQQQKRQQQQQRQEEVDGDSKQQQQPDPLSCQSPLGLQPSMVSSHINNQHSVNGGCAVACTNDAQRLSLITEECKASPSLQQKASDANDATMIVMMTCRDHHHAAIDGCHSTSSANFQTSTTTSTVTAIEQHRSSLPRLPSEFGTPTLPAQCETARTAAADQGNNSDKATATATHNSRTKQQQHNNSDNPAGPEEATTPANSDECQGNQKRASLPSAVVHRLGIRNKLKGEFASNDTAVSSGSDWRKRHDGAFGLGSTESGTAGTTASSYFSTGTECGGDSVMRSMQYSSCAADYEGVSDNNNNNNHFNGMNHRGNPSMGRKTMMSQNESDDEEEDWASVSFLNFSNNTSATHKTAAHQQQQQQQQQVSSPSAAAAAHHHPQRTTGPSTPGRRPSVTKSPPHTAATPSSSSSNNNNWPPNHWFLPSPPLLSTPVKQQRNNNNASSPSSSLSPSSCFSPFPVSPPPQTDRRCPVASSPLYDKPAWHQQPSYIKTKFQTEKQTSPRRQPIFNRDVEAGRNKSPTVVSRSPLSCRTGTQQQHNNGEVMPFQKVGSQLYSPNSIITNNNIIHRNNNRNPVGLSTIATSPNASMNRSPLHPIAISKGDNHHQIYRSRLPIEQHHQQQHQSCLTSATAYSHNRQAVVTQTAQSRLISPTSARFVAEYFNGVAHAEEKTVSATKDAQCVLFGSKPQQQQQQQQLPHHPFAAAHSSPFGRHSKRHSAGHS